MSAQRRKGTPALNSSQKRNLEAIAKQSILLDIPDVQASTAKRRKSPTGQSKSVPVDISSDRSSSPIDTPAPAKVTRTQYIRQQRATGALGSQTQHLLEGAPPDEAFESSPPPPHQPPAVGDQHPHAGLDDNAPFSENNVGSDGEDERLSAHPSQAAAEEEEDEDLLTLLRVQYMPVLPSHKHMKLNNSSRRCMVKDISDDLIEDLVVGTLYY